MKLLITILISVALISCHEQYSEIGLETSLYKKHFNRLERKQLADIISFVDSIVLSENKYNEINQAYKFYIDSIFILARKGDESGLSFNEKEKYSFLFNLDSVLFNKIWYKQTTIRMFKTKDTTLYNLSDIVTINFRPRGEYVEVIKELGKNIDYFNELYEETTAMGALSPASFAGFFVHSHNNDFDFNDPNYRLWCAIFLLTWEEPLEKKVDRYLKRQDSTHTEL